MYRWLLSNVALTGISVCLMSASWAQAQDYPRPPDEWGDNPPVRQNIGMLDTISPFLVEGDCRVCHNSGLPDRHHLLYGKPVAGSSHPYRDTNGDGIPDANYSCLSCHGPSFEVVRDCFSCHQTASPHHTGPDAFNRHCTACHGNLVDDFDDGHYIPTYSASLVTPWTGLHGEGWNDVEHKDPYRNSDGSGIVNATDVLILDTGITFEFGDVLTRTDPNELRFKPPGPDNDFMIDDPGRSGTYTYNVVFFEGAELDAVWDPAANTLTVILAPTQTAAALIAKINAAVAATQTGNRVVATKLLTDGTGPLLAPTAYAPLGGMPLNNRGFGAGSCSYCHDHDGALDENGDVSPLLILDNYSTHHNLGLPLNMSNGVGGTWRRCNVCHDYTERGGTYNQHSGPGFDLHIRVCEECHGPDSLHNIQGDSPAPNNIGIIVVGGEEPGYGHVGADGRAGESDCWGCHGFGFDAASASPVGGPVIPTLYDADMTTLTAGREAVLLLSGAAFINTAKNQLFESNIRLTAENGTTMTLEPDIILDHGSMAVTIPATVGPGNYRLQVTKEDKASNPKVVSIKPEVKITRAVSSRGLATISGSGFGGYAAGSGTTVTGTYLKQVGRNVRVMTMEGTVVSWSDRRIVASFPNAPGTVKVQSVFGTAVYRILPE